MSTSAVLMQQSPRAGATTKVELLDGGLELDDLGLSVIEASSSISALATTSKGSPRHQRASALLEGHAILITSNYSSPDTSLNGTSAQEAAAAAAATTAVICQSEPDGDPDVALLSTSAPGNSSVSTGSTGEQYFMFADQPAETHGASSNESSIAGGISNPSSSTGTQTTVQHDQQQCQLQPPQQTPALLGAAESAAAAGPPSALQLPDFAAFSLPEECMFVDSIMDDSGVVPTPHTPVVHSMFEGDGLPMASARMPRPNNCSADSSSTCSSSKHHAEAGSGCSKCASCGNEDDEFDLDPFPSAVSVSGLYHEADEGGAGSSFHHHHHHGVHSGLDMLQVEGWELQPFESLLVRRTLSAVVEADNEGEAESPVGQKHEQPAIDSLTSLDDLQEHGSPQAPDVSQQALDSQQPEQQCQEEQQQQQQQQEQQVQQPEASVTVAVGDSQPCYTHNNRLNSSLNSCSSELLASGDQLQPWHQPYQIEQEHAQAAVSAAVLEPCIAPSTAVQPQQQEQKQQQQLLHQRQLHAEAAATVAGAEPTQQEQKQQTGGLSLRDVQHQPQEGEAQAAPDAGPTTVVCCNEAAADDFTSAGEEQPQQEQQQPQQQIASVASAAVLPTTAAANHGNTVVAANAAGASMPIHPADRTLHLAGHPAQQLQEAVELTDVWISAASDAPMHATAPDEVIAAAAVADNTTDLAPAAGAPAAGTEAAGTVAAATGSGAAATVTVVAAITTDDWDAANKERLEEAMQAKLSVQPTARVFTYPAAEAELLAACSSSSTQQHGVMPPPHCAHIQQQRHNKLQLLLQRMVCGCSGSSSWVDDAAADQQQGQLMRLAKLPLCNDNTAHVALLQAVYAAYTGKQTTVARLGPHWATLGFQGDDPATDLRGAGVLGLLQLLYLHHHDRVAAQKLYQLSQSAEQEFPLAIVSLNITTWSLAACRSGRLKQAARQLGGLVTAANHFYCGAFYTFYARWVKGKTMAESGYVLRQLEQYCMRHPVQLLKLAASGLPS